MYSSLVLFALGNLIFLVLHLSGTGSFPKPLSAAETAVKLGLTVQQTLEMEAAALQKLRTVKN